MLIDIAKKELWSPQARSVFEACMASSTAANSAGDQWTASSGSYKFYNHLLSFLNISDCVSVIIKDGDCNLRKIMLFLNLLHDLE